MDENQAPQAPQTTSSKGGNSMMIIIIVVLLVVLGGGAFFFLSQNKPQTPATPQIPAEEETQQTQDEEAMQEPTQAMSDDASEVKAFTVEASNFKFSVPEIRVKQGDTVTITLVNKNGTHDFVIDEFNAQTKQITSGQTDEVTFIADKKGTFEFYCSVGTHRQMGMVGDFIVE